MFQNTEPLCTTESFIRKRVLKRGTSSESRALIEYKILRFFAIQLLRVIGKTRGRVFHPIFQTPTSGLKKQALSSFLRDLSKGR